MRTTRPVRTSRPIARDRKGSALVLVLILTVALAGLAISAIFLASNARQLGQSYDRESELRYAAEAALAIAKSRLNNDAAALPDTGYAQLLSNASLTAADGIPIPAIRINVFVGQTGSTTGQFGRFASAIAEVHDPRGARFVRRLELAQESFAKFAYWSNRESNGGSLIYFGNGDNLWGPVWSNDDIRLTTGGATFHNDVGTARAIFSKNLGTFRKGFQENQKPIALPNNAVLGKLQGYAAAANFAFSAPTNGSETSVHMRIEFVSVDLNADGDSLDADEGFFRVYTADPGSQTWLRGDWNATKAQARNCGDWHPVSGSAVQEFFPASSHATTWFRQAMQNAGMTLAAARAESAATVATIMQRPGARCYLGGDPHLVSIEAAGGAGQRGGTASTFTASGQVGRWSVYPGIVDARLAGRPDAVNLFPIHRSINPTSKGVIYVNGTTGVSGVLRGRITLYSNATIVILDDQRYANDPGAGPCTDMFGVIADRDIVVADNTVLTPQNVTGGGVWRNLDDTKDAYVHGVMMALNTSFRVQNNGSGPTNVNDCEGSNNGRGCLYLTGGLIQDTRGPVGTTGGTGFIKRYSYDRCAVVNPPPYFPTTGRFLDNRYYEMDPVNFNAASLFASLTPQP